MRCGKRRSTHRFIALTALLGLGAATVHPVAKCAHVIFDWAKVAWFKFEQALKEVSFCSQYIVGTALGRLIRVLILF